MNYGTKGEIRFSQSCSQVQNARVAHILQRLVLVKSFYEQERLPNRSNRLITAMG